MIKTIIFGGKIITMDHGHPEAEAVVIEGNKIIDIGGADMLMERYSDAELFNLGGATLMPGLNDSHCHMYNLGLVLTSVNLKGVKSVEEIGRRIHEFISNSPVKQDGWIWGRGWHDAFFTNQKMPTKTELDKITAEYPLVLVRTCGHVFAVNSKALEIAGINKDTISPSGGEIRRDVNGEPTGILTENATSLINMAMPKRNKEKIKEILAQACTEASKHGLVTVQSEDFKHVGDCNLVVQAYKELIDEGRMPVRIEEQMYFKTPEDLRYFLIHDYENTKKQLSGTDLLSLGPVKILLDGSLGGKTAYIKEPYPGETEYKGVLVRNPEELYELTNIAHTNGIPVACHAIGDGAIELVLDTIDKIQKETPNYDIRHRIIHCQITDSRLLQRIAKSNICLDIEPAFVCTDYKIVENMVGKEKAKTSYAWNTMAKLGIRAGAGSDAPVEDINPFVGIYAAVTRTDLQGNPEGGWNPQEKITVREAINLYTNGSAYVCNKDDRIGSIEIGKYADLIVLDKDPTAVDPGQIPGIKVIYRILDGNIEKLNHN
ncbi:MAG TPA: amidohydrolase [Clostridia bacterium]|nr:amidohydrolase [Clostridia bacterium]